MKFSITIPAYKRKYLSEAIDSCLSQTYRDFELIIVDDCSPENLYEIVRPYLKDEKIRYFRNEKNCGAVNVVDNWNICLNHAKGDYVICMGDDDKLLPCCLDEYAKLIEKYHGIGAVHGWTERIDENGHFVSIAAPRPEWEGAYSVLWNRWDNRMMQYIGDWCFNIEWLRSKGGFYKLPLAWGSDDITAVIGASKNGAANTQTLCFQYRVNSQTISKTGNTDKKVEAVILERLWYDSFLEKEPVDILDKKYWKNIHAIYKMYWDKKFGKAISVDIKKHPWNVFKWMRKGKHYGYGFKSFAYAIYCCLKAE